MWGKKRIYLDYAAATPICDAALAAYKKTSTLVGNPGGLHKEAVEAKEALEHARKNVASFLECKAQSVYFTSGGTEANNLAILGYARALEKEGRDLKDTHWIVSIIEHPSVLECFRELEKRSASVTYLAPNGKGLCTTSDVVHALRKETVFVSVGWANGEIGVVQPIVQIAKVIREHEKRNGRRVIFHTDAGQAPLYRKSTLDSLGVDLLTLDSGKCYGPKGIGLLYKKEDVVLAPILFGGGQERGLRPGSESTSLAAGFAAAFLWSKEVRESELERLSTVRKDLVKRLEELGGAVHGDREKVLPHIVNVSFENIQSEYVTLALDHRGIAISTKSACREGEEEESHVVKALGGLDWYAKNTLRISMGYGSGNRDIAMLAQEICRLAKN